MKKTIVLILKCILVMLPIIGIQFYAKNHMMKYADREIPNYIWNKNAGRNVDNQYYRVIILGDSVANSAYMPEVLSDSCINLSLGGITPMENYYTLVEYLDYNEPPKSVYISFMDSHFQATDCFWTRTMYSHRYSPKSNWEMLQNVRKFEEPSIWSDTAYLDWISYELYLPNRYITSLSEASFNQRYEGNAQAYAISSSHYGRYLTRGNLESPGETNYDTFYVAPLFDYYYKELVSLCVDRNIDVHIVKLPLPDIDTFSEQYIQEIDDYYGKLKEQFPSITFDWWGVYEGYCFFDSLHMNDHGALRFSSELKEKYPNDFDEDFSSRQLSGIDDYIITNNYLSDITQWLSICPYYTVIIYDSHGNFKDKFKDKYIQQNIVISEEIHDINSGTVYVLKNSANTETNEELLKIDSSAISVYPGDGTCYDWKPFDTPDLNVLVINNSCGKPICEKAFQYITEKDSFVMQ